MPLLVVDVQNDFADSRGSLSVRGGAEVVPHINAEIELALAGGAEVVYTGDWHPAHTPHFAQDGGIWPVHCVGETWGAELFAIAGVPMGTGSGMLAWLPAAIDHEQILADVPPEQRCQCPRPKSVLSRLLGR